MLTCLSSEPYWESLDESTNFRFSANVLGGLSLVSKPPKFSKLKESEFEMCGFDMPPPSGSSSENAESALVSVPKSPLVGVRSEAVLSTLSGWTPEVLQGDRVLLVSLDSLLTSLPSTAILGKVSDLVC